MEPVMILGRDRIGLVAESSGMRYYLTECCRASATGTGDGVACRACYELIDEQLGGLPDERWVPGQGFVRTELHLTEVFGDGIPADEFDRLYPREGVQ